ncbi:MAG: glycine cleavage system protein GcvH [Deltaproteobacteria bacterium]|nr:glycine cleavage system protein GcvH [Deltaproteobacteria bacterium]
MNQGVPTDRLYARTHVWARREGADLVRVGLTHVPGSYLGDAVYVELPPPGTEIASGEPIGLVESSSAVCEVVSPVSGSVVEINPVAEQSPETITADPYGGGWLLVVRPADSAGTDSLLSPEAYDNIAGE